MKIRIAGKRDAKQMLAIYAPYIISSAVTFEYEVPPVALFAQRVSDLLKTYPWLVCEYRGEIIGYAYASSYRDRAAYRWSCECSVYVQEKHQREGIAKLLYAALFNILRLQGFVNVYAVITHPNPASERFHQAVGFKKFAVYKKTGCKFGKWHDVIWMQLRLNKPSSMPPPPLLFSAIRSSQAVNDIMQANALDSFIRHREK